MKALPARPGFRCGFPCHYGGLSAARKHSRARLGVMHHCNRRVRERGQRCHEHVGLLVPNGFSITSDLDVRPEPKDVTT